MKLLIASICLFLLYAPAQGQGKTCTQKLHFRAPVCYASNDTNRVFVPAPEKYRLKSAEISEATIHVTYVGFSAEAKAAFEYAVDIWESLIKSPVTINMLARWTPLASEVLGSCTPDTYLENFNGAPLQDYYYPIALAEKLAGKELNSPNDFDIRAQFNSSNISWYLGTDGNTPNDKYDFVSVVLHEIGHGLGFTGLCYETATGTGGYAWIEDHPGIFDDFMINFDGNKLVDQSLFPNFSPELLEEFESGYLEFKSEWAKAVLNNTYPRLYAPLNYDEGSSLYHLNETTYFPGNPNSLMTPSIGRGEAIHNPGAATLAIMEEMGWIYTSIAHQELADTEDTTSPLSIEAKVVSDIGLDSTSVKVVYTYTDFSSVDTLQMNWIGSTDLFTVQIPVNGEGEIRYYLIARNEDGRNYKLPTYAPENYFNVLVGPDQIPPTLVHEPVKLLTENDQTLNVIAQAKDNIGIANVKIEYATNDDAFQSVNMEETQGEYRTSIDFAGLVDGDSIRYRLIATDSSSRHLTATLPENGYHAVSIEGFYEALTNYSNNFDEPDRDFFSASFTIGTGNGFENGSLNSPHPYQSPEQTDLSYDYITTLKHPIILQENGEMSFLEVVLVEPGESGSVFGDDEFWDYVIVEGSLDGETNWLPFIDGYDSRANNSWLTTYNSSLEGDNSTASGSRNLFISRTILLTKNGNFSAGQAVYIRFRLFSDPFANGWGWAIDNLLIQDPGTALATVEISPGELLLFPNPVKDRLSIQGSLKEASGDLLLMILNTTGQKLLEEQIDINSLNFFHEIDLSGYQPGVYVVYLQFKNGKRLSRKVILK